ncbi:MAG: hypothetical protein LBD24_02355 [Spirochaetaceae bacterium]|nr:hypothetical protein [Spirochaetaceae bacterium]
MVLMDHDKLKAALLTIRDAPLDFTLVFSGKGNNRVNGMYKAETREIVINDRNFTDNNLLLYTAVHEYAHHLHACARGGVLPRRSHTVEFWSILHDLLKRAEEKGLYRNVFYDSPELVKLTALIREKYLRENGTLVKELGMHLLKAYTLCGDTGGRFEDYLDRVLCIPRTAAAAVMRMYQYNTNPALGADNMRFVAGIRNEEKRTAAEAALLRGKSPDTVKAESKRQATGSPPPPAEEPRMVLEKEKSRIERTIAHLSKRLHEIEQALHPPSPTVS